VKIVYCCGVNTLGNGGNDGGGSRVCTWRTKLYPVCSARDTTLNSPMCACGGGDGDGDDDDYSDPATDGVGLNERVCVCVCGAAFRWTFAR